MRREKIKTEGSKTRERGKSDVGFDAKNASDRTALDASRSFPSFSKVMCELDACYGVLARHSSLRLSPSSHYYGFRAGFTHSPIPRSLLPVPAAVALHGASHLPTDVQLRWTRMRVWSLRQQGYPQRVLPHLGRTYVSWSLWCCCVVY